MKKLILITITTLLLISGCSTHIQKEEGKLHIVTTLFPQYDLLKQIAGDKATVSMLLPPGAEAHGYEPTPQDMVVLNDSDLFVYTSDHLESYAASMVKSLNKEDMTVVNIEENLHLEEEDHSDHDHDHEEHDHVDVHFWLDPIIMVDVAQVLNEALSNVDPDNKAYYDENTKKVISDLETLDSELKRMFEESENDTIVFAGHYAFDFFSERYGLKYITPFEGYSANAEASSKKVSELIDYINANDVKVVYFEELVDPKLAKMLAKETGAKTLVLHGAHNVSKDELNNNITYIDIMYQNLENLKEGLSGD